MDPNNVQAFGQFNHQADLQRVVPLVAPLATTWHGVAPGPSINYAAPQTHATQGVLPAFWGKIESIGKEAGSIGAGVAPYLAHAAVDAVKVPYRLGSDVSRMLDYQKGNQLQAQSKQLSDALDRLMSDYKSGKITSKQYTQGVKQYTQDATNLQHDLSNFQSKSSAAAKAGTVDAIGTAADIAAIVTLGGSTAGLEAAQRAAFSSLAEGKSLSAGAEAIAKLAGSHEAWNEVSPLAQQAVKLATTQVLQAAGRQATAQQIARATAVKVMFTFPLTYDAITGGSQQIYDDMQKGKYGDAAVQVGLMASMLLSGGPIGWGLKKAGAGARAVSVAAGIRPGSILDELSSRIGDGNRRALGEIAANLVNEGKSGDVKSMVVALESNLQRAGGNPSQAINFIQDHLENYVSWGSLQNMTHQQVWDNLVSYFKHAEGLQKLKSAGEIEGIAASDSRSVVPGRFTIADRQEIARANSWEEYARAHPNTAAANNVNLQKQVKRIFDTIKDEHTRTQAIMSIPAQWGLKGVPADYAKQMAKDGYVAIVPKAHNLPAKTFEETSGKLVTNAAKGDYFVKASQPVPVLRSIGAALTFAGMSPEMAGARVSQVFAGNLSRQLENVGFQRLAGDTAEQTAKDVYSKLSNYMKQPTAAKFKLNGNPLRVPITDMRQLTHKDVMTALGISSTEARKVQDAIMQAHLEVPRQIAGLGGKILDYNFKYNPVAAPYSRIQGATRFAWNPVFTQGRLPIKAEILAQLKTGGKFPTIAGTNTFMKLFFPGQYKEIDGIANNPEFRKLLPGGFGDMGADFTNVTESSERFNINTRRPAAGLVRNIADKMGMDVETLIHERPDIVSDAAQSLLHYDRHASFLNSPMARTLNMAIFPFRFNVKVAGYMAKFLAKQDPGVQYAAITGIMNAHKFLNSPQGQAWYSAHSDAIKLFGYFSPLETISVISNALGLKHDSIAQYGELGGLPFGIIPQITDSVGMTHFSQAYVNPKTGVIGKDYVPTSMYGAANAAIQDLLSSMYTYPGAEAGLPSKGTFNRTIAGGILPGSNKDFTGQTPTNVTPEEQQFSQNVQATNGTSQQGTEAPTPTFLPGQSVPAQHSSLEDRNPNKTIKAAKASKSGGSGTKKKKAEYTPALLPGQSSLGQL